MIEQAKIDALVDDLAGDMRDIVASIEKGMKTTQNHYGRYMSLILAVGQDDPATKKIVALALVKAGANQAGVTSALSLTI